MTNENIHDVVVIGGGAAGLNGALMLVRSRRSVLVIDAGQPRNAPAAAMHGMIGHDGLAPAELLARGRAEVTSYGGEFRSGAVTGARRVGDEFVVTVGGDQEVRARRLLVTTGLVDELPEVAGLAEHWGHDVVHCPYCHGWEVRDRRIIVLGTGPMAVHQALLFSQLSSEVTLLVHSAVVSEEQRADLAARDIDVVDGTAVSVESASGAITGLRLADDKVLAGEVIAVATRMVARADFLADLGLTPVQHPSGMGVHLPVDQLGRTAVPGVWAAGNVTDMTAQVGASAAAGAMAGAQINADLVMARS